MKHEIERVTQVKRGNLAMRAFGYQCTCGWASFRLEGIGEHVVKNQYEVKSNGSGRE